MKYITKELIVSEWLSEVNRHLKVSKRAEKKDEKFYDSVYKKQCSVFLSNESNCSIYRDPKEELRKINEYVNESGIDEEERLKRLEFKKIHEKVNAKRIARGIKFEFDEEKDGDIYIKGEEETIIIENGEIIEGKGKAVYKFDDSIPNSPWSNIIAAELYCENDKFEAHLFVFECNENYEEGNWYLTVSGTDVRLITE